jgi:hypothetical protein
MGGVVDTVGDVLGGAADFVGDVAGGIGDFAGDVIEDFGPEIATAIALYYGVPYAAGAGAAGAGAGGLGAGLIAPEVAALGSLGTTGAGLGGVGAGLGSLGAIGSSLAGSSLLPGTIPGGGYQGGFIKTGIEGLDSALNLAKSGYDLYGLYNQTQQPTQQIPSLTYQQTSSGTQVDPNAFGQGLQYSFIAGLPELGDITDIITRSVSGLGNILLNAFGSDNLAEVIKKYGPAVLSVIGGKLSYDDQKRINDIVMGVYNKYNVGTELKNLQYRTGQGLAALPIFRSTKQLGSQTTQSAPQRTAADVVVRPKAQMGGIMQLGTEQEEPIFPRLETLSQNLGQAEQTLGQPSNQSNMSSITTAITGQQPQGFADGGYTDDEMETKKEFYYGRKRDEMEDLLDEYERFKMRKDYQRRYPRDEARNGGRMGYAIGSTQQPMQMQPMNRTQGISRTLVTNAMKDPRFKQILQQVKAGKTQGRPGYKFGSLPMRTNQAGITEIDYRQKGGFVPPIGVKEKADDIPAMLSNNEFVFTANAVRGAGGGSVKKGAERMYGLMKQLEGKA